MGIGCGVDVVGDWCSSDLRYRDKPRVHILISKPLGVGKSYTFYIHFASIFITAKLLYILACARNPFLLRTRFFSSLISLAPD